MKESSQQLETSTIELTKFRSNTNEGSSLSINKELQLYTFFTQDLHQRDKDNVNNVFIDFLGEGESTSAIQCLDHEIGKDKELPRKLENSERGIGNQKIPIGNNKEEGINYSHETNIPPTHSPTYKKYSSTIQYILSSKYKKY